MNKRESDRMYPTWAYQERIAAFLGPDPLDTATTLDPHRDEITGIASLRSQGPSYSAKRFKNATCNYN